MTHPARIDVHQHIVPPAYASWLTGQGISAGGMPIPQWSKQAAMAMMDGQGIRTGVLSISTPGVHLGDAAEARHRAREVNEAAADVVKDRPDRFGFFATLTLPDVDGSLAETAYALDELGADGVILLANSRGHYLGEADFDPLMAELDRRGTVVFVHPSHLPGQAVLEVPAYLADFLLDTTRAALHLVRSGTMARYRRMKVILSHAGGFVPYASHRFAQLSPLSSDVPPSPGDFLDDLRRFYFDTALSASPAALPSLLAFADPTHILYGSDWPYAPEQVGGYFATELDASSDVDSDRRAAINRGNAELLFPRLR